MKYQILNGLPPFFDYWQICDYLNSYKYKGMREKIRLLIKTGEIVRVKKGLYVLSDSYKKPYDTFALANLIYGPSYVTSLTALSFYGAIPERVEEVISINPKRSKFFETPVGRFLYYPMKNDLYHLGITQVKNIYEQNILIASKEKSLIDKLRLDKIYQKEDIAIFINDMRINESFLRELSLEILSEFQSTSLNKKNLVSNLYSLVQEIKNDQ